MNYYQRVKDFLEKEGYEISERYDHCQLPLKLQYQAIDNLEENYSFESYGVSYFKVDGKKRIFVPMFTDLCDFTRAILLARAYVYSQAKNWFQKRKVWLITEELLQDLEVLEQREENQRKNLFEKFFKPKFKYNVMYERFNTLKRLWRKDTFNKRFKQFKKDMGQPLRKCLIVLFLYPFIGSLTVLSKEGVFIPFMEGTEIQDTTKIWLGVTQLLLIYWFMKVVWMLMHTNKVNQNN
ncbi:hypothetical protein [Bacillus pumilus]|uniref:hypothetical protein n=1 Tax=Bacillus pumilus TaxID=1408 RepID=UPI0011AA2A76|nr:hypothetical protein [Bacillus pumilus]